MGEGKILERIFPSPTPLSFQELSKKGIIYIFYIVRSTVESAMFAQTGRVGACSHRLKVFSQVFFKKLARVKGRVAPFIVRPTQERVNFFAEQRKRENPRRGFSFF